MSLNMKKEIREEIRQLRTTRHKVALDWNTEVKRLGKELRKIESSLKATNRNCDRAMSEIDRRIAILQGRLS